MKKTSKLLSLIINNKSWIILILLILVASVVSKGLFFTADNLISVLKQNSYLSILALGFLVVLSSGNLDLSVGHLMGLLAISFAMMSSLMPEWLAFVVTLVIGVVAGLFNGILTIKLGLTPFILTLATGQMFRGFAYLLCDGRSITVLTPICKFLGSGKLVGNLPFNFALVIILTIILQIVITHTSFGTHLLATGGNEAAAKVSGVNTQKTKIHAFMICGFFNAIAAVMVSGRVTVAMPSVGDGLEMDAVAAVIIGGTSLSGGKANVPGAIVGALILGIITNMLNLAKVSAYWQWVVKGIIIVLAILIDVKSELLINKSKKA